jgi:ABC transport system ATP-binding/permease protein
VIHVGGWAARFLFSAEQLNQKVGRLSGGERARVLIAQLMLQPADVLLLDEPTNDLDIPTLEILEESLLEYRGALVLVTHDRYMLDRVSTVVLGLDGAGGAERFADYSQWEEWSRERKAATRKLESAAAKNASGNGTASGATTSTETGRLAAAKKKLSYKENRELETIEQRVAEAEADLQAKHDALLDPAIMSDGVRLHAVSLELEAAQKRIDELYTRWVELEDKLK